MSYIPLRFTTYLTTIDLLDDLKDRSHETIRAEGITLQSLKHKPLEQILAWTDLQRRVTNSQAEDIEDTLHYLTWFIVIIMGVSGYGLSSVLLEYGGTQLVNVLTYFLVLVLIPFLFSVYTLLYLLMHRSASTKSTHSILKLLIKLLNTLPFGDKERLQALLRHQLLLKNISLSYLQYGSIALSLGALLSLMITISTQDIAFGWNTTLQVTPELFNQFTQMAALPWQALFPSAVPSLELIEVSQHYRLGNKLDPELIAQAKALGSWWQFLALSLVVWTLIPRVLLIILTQRNIRLSIERLLLSHPNSSRLLKQMNETYITTHATTDEAENHTKTSSQKQLQHNKPIQTAALIAWNFSQDQLAVIIEAKQITADQVYFGGGKNTLKEDSDIIEKVKTPTVILVKAWEPPMRDLLEFVNDLYSKTAEAVTILPVGTAQKHFSADEADISIWRTKISSLQVPEIGIHHDTF